MTARAELLSNELKIRELFAGNTISGEERGETYIEFFSPDGGIVGENSEGRYTGHWQVSRGRICLSYDEENGKAGAWDCAQVGLNGSRIVWSAGGEKSYSTLTAGNPRGL
ncbi:MAG: hypothetical protein C3F11_18730 [Methylocystaceae bacterium]|nr:MAG: hypothetical protein C3F11_18730 [Methylocystaceae bacterium]